METIKVGERKTCKCGKNDESDPHGCPYAEEINDDYEFKCTCCSDCMHECCMDILPTPSGRKRMKMKTEVDTSVTINGIKYVPESDSQTAKSVDGLAAVIIRSDRAGVFYGYMSERNGNEVVLLKSRRVFYWSGAASLSQLAIDGTSKPNDCKFPEALERHMILGVIEIIPMTEKALKSLNGVPVWKQ